MGIFIRAFAVALIVVTVSTQNSDAANKSEKPKMISPSDYFMQTIKYKLGKKNKSASVACLKGKAGSVKSTKKGVQFTPLSLQVKKAKGAKLENLKALSKAVKKGCATPPTNSLERYKGQFGEAEAQVLFNRFAFGASPAQIQAAVARGLEKTVDQLLTYVPDPEMDAVRASFRCNGHLPGDPEGEPCDPTDRNDIYTEGVRMAEEYAMIHSKNPYFQKMFLFFHDERLAVSSSAASWCERYALVEYVEKVHKLAIHGNYKTYMDDMNNDLLMHLSWLDGEDNHNYEPNENWAREFWELGTVGPTNLDGNPVYSDLDIAQAALAFTGNVIDYYTVNGHGICLQSYVEGLHAQGPKTIFNGTPYQSVVYDAKDMLEATFRHPRVAEHLAEDIWKEFINGTPSAPAIKQLAQVIRDNNFDIKPVMRQVMLSQAVYNSRGALIKHPSEMLAGFLRQTGIPLDYYYIDQSMGDLGQRILQPATVFGWNEKALSGEAWVLPWWNELLMITTQSTEEFVEYGYDLHGHFLANLPTQGTAAQEAIKRIASTLGITLNAAQFAMLEEYMDNYWRECRSWSPQSKCGQGQAGYLERDAFDANPAADYEMKLRGAISILAMLPQYRMK